MNAFQPATELDDPDRFAGRSMQVRMLADALHSTGSVPLIFGDRGLGKSSLALQLRLIAMGNVELLTQFKAERLALPADRHFLVFYVTCTDTTEGLSELLQALVNSAESVDTSGPSTGAGQLIDRTTRKKLTLKVFEFESTLKYQTESQRLSYQDLNLEEKLVLLCEILTRTYGQPVMFIIDELDRMRDTRGLASFLKAASSETLKFVLVGIAGNVSDLLNDHQSLERKLVPVKVPVMTPRELGEIVSKANAYLEDHGVQIVFTQSAYLLLVETAAGFPWFVHVLGQRALMDADDGDHELDARGNLVINAGDVQHAITTIVENQFAQQFSDMYQMAVRDSYNREVTLRAFAHWTDADIPTGEVYRVLAKLKVNGASTYRGHLCRSEFGSVLFVPAFQKRGLVRFRNEMFKAYVRMRPSIYDGVDRAVAAAYRTRAQPIQ
jgi:hypothetical protein